MNMSNTIVISNGKTGKITISPSAKNNNKLAASSHKQEPDINAIQQQAFVKAQLEMKKTLDSHTKAKAEACHKCMEKLDSALNALREEISERVIELSVRIAEIILHHTLPDHQMISELIKQTLTPISDLQGVRIRMNSLDVEKLKTSIASPVLLERIDLVSDPTLAAGDVIVESKNGIFDARIEQRLKLLEEKLKQKVAQSE
jgi:flagellar biosynthesis/type III secretory pathway protein FliH